jgi:excinuclease ABC subunit A
MHVVASSDWVIDIGPGAGLEGGKVVAEGTPEQVMQVSESKTALYLSRETRAGSLIHKSEKA